MYIVWVWLCNSPIHTVGCSEDPAWCYDGASTHMFIVEVETDLPGELTWFGNVSSNNTSAVQRPGAALWRQTYDNGQKAVSQCPHQYTCTGLILSQNQSSYFWENYWMPSNDVCFLQLTWSQFWIEIYCSFQYVFPEQVLWSLSLRDMLSNIISNHVFHWIIPIYKMPILFKLYDSCLSHC